jgi:hypothetical protein
MRREPSTEPLQAQKSHNSTRMCGLARIEAKVCISQTPSNETLSGTSMPSRIVKELSRNV